MPIYEYICETCDRKFEMIRSIKDSDLSSTCTHCGGSHTHRAVSACYAHTGSSSGYASTSHSTGGCGGCSGGSCGSCHH